MIVLSHVLCIIRAILAQKAVHRYVVLMSFGQMWIDLFGEQGTGDVSQKHKGIYDQHYDHGQWVRYLITCVVLT